jgi:hypothetical protein
MQSRLVSRLARKLRSTHRKTKSWRVTANIHRVLTPDRELNPGLAKRIAERWQPGLDVIKRLLNDGAIELDRPKPMILSYRTRQAFIEAFKKRGPLPSPTPKTMKLFDDWIERGRLMQ